MENLKSYLLNQSKHGLYQMLPPELLKQHPEFKKFSFNRRLDDKRYDWFSNTLDFEGKNVLDIGGNIGYFSFRLNMEKNSTITIYEPHTPHINAIEAIKSVLQITDRHVTCVNQGVGLDDIESLPEQDIILLFNVLQHAGEDYDKKYVRDISQWRKYAIDYLKAIGTKTKYLVFQMGYSWLGHEANFCEDNDVIPFTTKLLTESGWKIKQCGVVASVFNPHYVDFNLKNINAKPPINNKFDWFASRLMNKLKILPGDYRFMQRPVFICKK